MNRRESLIALLAISALGSPQLLRAQPTDKMRRIGVLMGIAEDQGAKERVSAFQQTLEKLGWVEGRNARFVYRWAAGDTVRVQAYAKELIGWAPDVLVGGGITPAVALARQTQTIPIVFAHASDPLGSGLVASLSRPGGNVTGFTAIELTVPGKYLEILKEIAPRIAEVSILYGSKTVPGARAQFLKALESDAASLRLRASLLPLDGVAAIDRAIAAIAGTDRMGLVVLQDIFTAAHLREIITTAARHRLPAIYPAPQFASDGGLVAYGANPIEAYQGAAGYVDRILKGEKPANLPVQQPVKYEFVVNARTAKTLGLTIPPSILVRATKVIE